MNLSEMIRRVGANIDDVGDQQAIVDWLNDAKDEMSAEVKASFPDITINSDLSNTFVFDKKYHYIPVLYASAMFKAADGEEGPKQSLLGQFYNAVKNFSENYVVPPRYRDDDCTQQFVASAGQVVFVVTKTSYSPQYGNLIVYKNDIRTEDFDLGEANDFILDVGATAGDCITAVWEQHSAFEQPPYPWWKAW